MIYQNPLAYLLGLEGLALLDAWAGDHDRAFVETRLAEIRQLLDDKKLLDRGVLAESVSTVTAYRQQSASYDAESQPPTDTGSATTWRPALSLGFQVKRCEEPGSAPSDGPLPEPTTEIGDWRDWPWSLMDDVPSAARAAGGCLGLVIWHFQLPAA